MKKTLIAISALLIAAITSNAQSRKDSLLAVKALKKITNINSENDLKPKAGSFSTELNVNPLKGDLSFNNSLNQIKFRYFSTSGFAWRFGINVKVQDSSYSNKQVYGSATNSNVENSRKGLTLGANLGFEKHFKGTRRLSPYIGLDLSITDQSNSTESTTGQVTTKVKNAWYSRVPYVYYSANTGYQTYYEDLPTQYAFTRFGINFITGFDFYMAKNFFLGYEFNFGLNTTKYKDPETTVTGQTASSSSNNNTEYDTKNKSLSFGPGLMNGIRIGYVF